MPCCSKCCLCNVFYEIIYWLVLVLCSLTLSVLIKKRSFLSTLVWCYSVWVNMFYVHSPVRAPAGKYNAWLLVSESPEDGSNATDKGALSFIFWCMFPYALTTTTKVIIQKPSNGHDVRMSFKYQPAEHFFNDEILLKVWSLKYTVFLPAFAVHLAQPIFYRWFNVLAKGSQNSEILFFFLHSIYMFFVRKKAEDAKVIVTKFGRS